MAVRFYTSNVAAPYTPTTKQGAWNTNSATSTKHLAPRPSGTAATLTQSEASGTNLYDVLLGRWVSDAAVTAGTLGGNLAFTLGRRESNTAQNAFWHIHLYATTGDSDTPRGTLLADWVGAVEWPTTAAAETVTGVALNPVAVQAGDRLVLEVGYQDQNTSTTSYSGTINYGGAGLVDLVNAATTVTTNPGWIELDTADALFAPPTSAAQDTFSAGTLADPPWTDSYGGADVTAGQARIPCAHTAGTPDWAGIQTPPSYRLDDLYARITPAPVNGATVTCYTALAVTDQAVEGTSLHARIDVVTGLLRLESNVDYFDETAVELTYDPDAHAWLRITRSGSNILWQTSPDAATWTTRRTLAAPSWCNYGGVDVLVESARDGGTNNFAYVDAVNVAVVEVQGAATLGAATSLTAGATRAAIGGATLSASTSLTAAATRTTTAAAALTAGTALAAAAATPDRPAAATLSAATSLTSAATPDRPAGATLSAATQVTAAATPTRPAAAVLAASTALTAAGMATAQAATTLSAATQLDASTAGSTGGSANLTAATALMATVTQTQPAGANLGASAALAAGGTATTTASVALAASTALDAAATPVRPAGAALGAATALTVAATPERPASAALAASSSLAAAGTPIRTAGAQLAAATSLTGTPDDSPAAVLTAGASLAAGATATRAAGATLTARTVIVATAVVPQPAPTIPGRAATGGRTPRGHSRGTTARAGSRTRIARGASR